MTKTFVSNSITDQEGLLIELNALRKQFSIFLFQGEMGAGKTTVIKNLCTFMGVVDKVSSPTYSLVNEYQTELGEVVYHFDFYRINDEFEALDMGVEDYLNSSDLCLIEWPEKIQSLLPNKHLLIAIHEIDGKRKMTITSNN